jgi:hypothetical protein
MFLTNEDKTLEDFLSAINFVSPNGMDVQYFISPNKLQLPQGSGFQPQIMQPKPEDESQVYIRTQPIQKIDQAQTPGEFSQWNPGELTRRQPTPNLLPDVTDPGEQEVGCPFVKVLSESKMLGTDIKLMEDFHMFPKHTVFHCVLSNKLSEAFERSKTMGFMTRMMAGRPSISMRSANEGPPMANYDMDEDIISLYKTGLNEEEIYDELMTDKWYQKEFKGEEKQFFNYIKNRTRTYADNRRHTQDYLESGKTSHPKHTFIEKEDMPAVRATYKT